MLTISPPPELEAQLRLEAEKRGLEPEQLLLQTLIEKWAPSMTEVDDADETAALDELVGCLADVPSITTEWRRTKEAEMSLEEEKFLRRFRGRQTQ